MVLKRKLFKKKQLLLKFYHKKHELNDILNKSFFKNHYNHYILRLSFTVNDCYSYTSRDNFFFKSQQKLICLQTLCKKVPNKHFQMSRFYLNKQLHTLKLNNVYK